MKEHIIKWTLYLIAVVLINVAGVTLFFRWDLTENQIFSLSDASKKAVATLSEPMDIKVFFSQNLPAPYNNTQRYLADLLQEYAAQAGKYFNYTFYDISSQEAGLGGTTDANRQMADSYGISPVQIRMVENDEIKFQNSYMGLVIIHGDLMEKIPAIADTSGLEYQLTTAIQKLNNKISALVRIQDKVQVELYLSSSLNQVAPLMGLDEFPGLAHETEKVIARLNSKNANIFELVTKNPLTKEEITKIAETNNLMVLSWPGIPEKQIQPGQGLAGIVVRYKDKSQSIPLITAFDLPIIGTTYQMTAPRTLETGITAIMEKTIGINKTIGYLADHGTPALGQDSMAMMQGGQPGRMQVFHELLSSRYDIKPVSLGDNGSIPPGLNCLIIVKPTQKFSEYELFQIDQALMKGTNIAFFGDAFEEIMPRGGMGMPQFPVIDTGIAKLFTHYGISMKPAYVLDTSSYKHNPGQAQGGGQQNIYFAPVIKEKTINLAPPYMKNIKGLVAMQICPLFLEDKNIDSEKLTATRLFSSSKEAWLMEGTINLNPMFLSPPSNRDDFSSYDLAYMLEGTFSSYFANKGMPEKPAGETDISETVKANKPQKPAPKLKSTSGTVVENRLIKASKPAKIFFLGCSQMLQDNMLDPQGRSTNATFILNVLDHLNDEDEIALLRSKEQSLNPVGQLTPLTKTLIKGWNIAVLPCLTVIFGLAMWIRRNARKKAITKMFSNENTD